MNGCAQSCPTLCDPMDCSLPGSSVRGIFQARTLEGVAMPFSRESSDPGIEPMSPEFLAFQADSLPLSHSILSDKEISAFKNTFKIV